MLKVNLRTSSRTRRFGGLFLLALCGCGVYLAHEPQGWRIDSLVLIACLSLIGVFLIAERHLLVVDQQAGVVTRRRGLLLTFTMASVAIAKVKGVALRPYVKRKPRSDDDETRYLVRAIGGPQLAVLTNPWHARHVAEQICRALNVPFDNRIYGKKSVRQASELDLSVAERWRAAGEVHERPTLPLGSALSVEQKGSEVCLWVPATELYSLTILAILMAVFAAMAVLFYQLTMERTGDRVFLVGFFGLCGLFLCLAALSKSGRSRVKFSDRRLSVRLGLMPFSFSMPLERIEEMIPANDSIVLVGDSMALSVDWPKSNADKEYLQAFVAYELGRRGSAAPTNPSC